LTHVNSHHNLDINSYSLVGKDVVLKVGDGPPMILKLTFPQLNV